MPIDKLTLPQIENNKIRIAYLIDTISCDTAGTQKQLIETIKRLDKDTFTVCLICLWQSEWMAVNTLPCPCYVLGYNGFVKASFLNVILKLRRLIAEQNIQLVQTFFEDSIFVAYFSVILAHSRPVLISSRRDMGLGEKSQPWYHNLFRLVLPLVNKAFAGIIANSEQVRKYAAVRERVPFEKITVIRNGVSLPEVPERIPEIFSNGQETVWIGLAASLSPVKRQDILLQAAAILKRKLVNKPFRVVFLGEGPYRVHLEQLCSQLQLNDIVCFSGAVKDVSRYLHHVDICVLCSDREGLSNAILEYMACGKPVIATAVGGNTELVNDRNGILVSPDDPIALADALAELVLDEQKRRKMGAVSLTIAAEQFSWKKSMADLENYYREKVGEL